MLNSVNLSLVTFARQHGNLDGQVGTFFVMVVAAAEVVVGLAIIVAVMWSRTDDRESKRLDRKAERDGDADLSEYNRQLAKLASHD